MAESTNISEPKPGLMSRRRFIRNTTLSVGATAAGSAAGIALIQKASQPAQRESLPTSEPDINYINPELAPFINDHPMLINFSDYHRAVAAQRTEQEIYDYKREKNPRFASLKEAVIEDVSQRARNSASYQMLIDEKANLLGFKPDSFVRKVAPAVIFVESEGEEGSNLFQLEPVIAQAIANELGIDLGKDRKHLLNPHVNTMIALEYMSRLYKLFPDPTLAIWAFNLGETIMANAIYAYVMSTAKSEAQEEFIKNKFKSKSEAATTYYVGFLKINFVDLSQSQAAVDSIRADLANLGEPFEYHQNYVPKVLAGDFLIQQAQETKVRFPS